MMVMGAWELGVSLGGGIAAAVMIWTMGYAWRSKRDAEAALEAATQKAESERQTALALQRLDASLAGLGEKLEQHSTDQRDQLAHLNQKITDLYGRWDSLNSEAVRADECRREREKLAAQVSGANRK